MQQLTSIFNNVLAITSPIKDEFLSMWNDKEAIKNFMIIIIKSSSMLIKT